MPCLGGRGALLPVEKEEVGCALPGRKGSFATCRKGGCGLRLAWEEGELCYLSAPLSSVAIVPTEDPVDDSPSKRGLPPLTLQVVVVSSQ